MRGPAGGGEFEWEGQHVVGNLSGGTSKWWGILVRGPAGGGI